MRSTADGVAGCGAVSVALMSWASSIAIFGVGGEPLRVHLALAKQHRVRRAGRDFLEVMGHEHAGEIRVLIPQGVEPGQ